MKRIIALAAAGAIVAGSGSPHTADAPQNTPTAAVPNSAQTSAPSGPQYTDSCVTGYVKPTPFSNYGMGVTQYTNKLHHGKGHGNDDAAYKVAITNNGSSTIIVRSFSVTFTPSATPDQEQPGSMAGASAWAIPAGESSTWLELSNISYNGQGGPGEGEGTAGNGIVNGGLSVLPNNARSCQASVTLGT